MPEGSKPLAHPKYGQLHMGRVQPSLCRVDLLATTCRAWERTQLAVTRRRDKHGSRATPRGLCPCSHAGCIGKAEHNSIAHPLRVEANTSLAARPMAHCRMVLSHRLAIAPAALLRGLSLRLKFAWMRLPSPAMRRLVDGALQAVHHATVTQNDI